MRAGDLKHRVQIEQLQRTQDPITGEIKQRWVGFTTTWARILPLSAREFMNAQAMQSKVMGRITIRFIPGISPDMRIREGKTVYNIEGILPDPHQGNRYLTIPYSIGVNDG